jgi:hypothetical protein
MRRADSQAENGLSIPHAAVFTNRVFDRKPVRVDPPRCDPRVPWRSPVACDRAGDGLGAINRRSSRHVPQEAGPTAPRGRRAAALVPRLRRCQLFPRGNPSPMCRAAGGCSPDGAGQSCSEDRRTQRKTSTFIPHQPLAETLSTMPGETARPQYDLRLRLSVRQEDEASIARHRSMSFLFDQRHGSCISPEGRAWKLPGMRETTRSQRHCGLAISRNDGFIHGENRRYSLRRAASGTFRE